MAERSEEGVLAEQVVSELLAACRLSTLEAAGILWALGADKLRRTVGDPAHLEMLLGNELFSPLVCFERAEQGPLEQIDDSARQTITVFLPSEAARFLVSLKRSPHGERAGRWLITGLERVLDQV